MSFNPLQSSRNLLVTKSTLKVTETYINAKATRKNYRRLEPDPFLFLSSSHDVAWRCLPFASLRSPIAAMTGAKQSRRCNLLTFFSTILATVLLLIFQRFSPTAAAVPQWRRGGTQEHIDVARGAEAVGHGQGRCEDSLRGGSSRWRRRRGFADGGRGTRVRLALQHAAVGNWYRLGTLRVLPHLLGEFADLNPKCLQLVQFIYRKIAPTMLILAYIVIEVGAN